MSYAKYLGQAVGRMCFVTQSQEEIRDNFFRTRKTGRNIDKLPTEFEKKTAFVVVGLKSSGKSAFVDRLSKMYPGFSVLKYQDFEICGYDALVKRNKFAKGKLAERNAEVFAKCLFEEGLKRLNNYRAHLIIEGDFLDIAKRSALVRTLKEWNYSIVIISLLDVEERRLKRMVSNKAIDYIVGHRLLDDIREEEGFIPINRQKRILEWNVIDRAEKYYRKPKEEIIAEVLEDPKYLEVCHMLFIEVKNNAQERYINEQNRAYAFHMGVDEVIASKKVG